MVVGFFSNFLIDFPNHRVMVSSYLTVSLIRVVRYPTRGGVHGHRGSPQGFYGGSKAARIGD